MSNQQKKLWIELAPSKSYLSALGRVISQWAYFESEFDGAIRFMMMEPTVKALVSKPPFAFKKRLKLFADASKICFTSCPKLITRLNNIRYDAKRLKKLRDHIAHCTWAGEASSGHLETYILKNGDYQTEEITLSMLHDASCEISELTRRIAAITRGGSPFWSDFSFPLTSEEESAIRNFRDHNLPKLPTPDKSLLPPPPSRE